MHRLLGICITLLLAAGTAPGQDGNDPIVVATWNVALRDLEATDLQLDQFSSHCDADVLVVNEVKTPQHMEDLRDGLGRSGDHITISNFVGGESTLEVGIISRHPFGSILEHDTNPEGAPGVPEEDMERVSLDGLENRNAQRGYLEAHIPTLDLIVIATHLKSSLGRTGESDADNARKRETVMASIADRVNELLADDPGQTIFVAGDINVGVTDNEKNGTSLSEDNFSGPGDRYDETHALLTSGLVDGLRMRNLAENLSETFLGFGNTTPPFQGSGAIDAIYVAGATASAFAPAQALDTTLGSDHFAIFTTNADTLPCDCDCDCCERCCGEDSPSTDPIHPGDGTVAVSGIMIQAVLPDPAGQDAGNERITIHNPGPPITINGWFFQDAKDNTFQIPGNTVLVNGPNDITLHRKHHAPEQLRRRFRAPLQRTRRRSRPSLHLLRKPGISRSSHLALAA